MYFLRQQATDLSLPLSPRLGIFFQQVVDLARGFKEPCAALFDTLGVHGDVSGASLVGLWSSARLEIDLIPTATGRLTLLSERCFVGVLTRKGGHQCPSFLRLLTPFPPARTRRCPPLPCASPFVRIHNTHWYVFHFSVFPPCAADI